MSRLKYQLKLTTDGTPTDIKADTVEELAEALHQLATNIEQGWRQGPVFANLDKAGECNPRLCSFAVTTEGKA